MKKTLLTIITAALAGCTGSPNWKEPEMNQKPIVLEDERPVEAPKKKDTPVEETVKDYSTVELSVAYGSQNSLAASGFEGYIALLQKDKGREFTDYERMQAAFRLNKEGTVSTTDISNVIVTYAKEKGLKEVRIPFAEVDEDNLKRVYTERIAVSSDEVGAELAKMIEDKTEAEKSRVAEAVRAFYNGKDPLTMKQLQKILFTLLQPSNNQNTNSQYCSYNTQHSAVGNRN
jgi:hypothetical protein